MNALARDKITIFDRDLPRVAMSLSQLKRQHARILRRFASCPDFDSEQLTIRIKAREGSKTFEFASLNSFLEYVREPDNDTPDSLELSYQYAKVVHNGSTTMSYDVVMMNASVLFGEAGRNECYITSNLEEWANETHNFIKSELARYKIPRWSSWIKNSAFGLAVLSLGIFGLKFFPFSSPESMFTMGLFFAAAILVAWPLQYFPFKQIAGNRINLS